jgi:hypothetical protein
VRCQLARVAPGEPAANLPPGIRALKLRASELRDRFNAAMAELKVVAIPVASEVERELAEAHADTERLSEAIEAAEAALGDPKRVFSEADSRLRDLERTAASKRGTYDIKTSELLAERAEATDSQLSEIADEVARQANVARESLIALEREQGESCDVIDARIRRLEAAERNHSEEIGRMKNEITRVGTWIEANEGAGLEEALEATHADLERREAVEKDYRQEAAVLRLLLDTLRTAEFEAKAKYLGPVTKCVEPYLRMLLPGADIVIDEEFAVSALARNGVREDFERLSGGTQEQIAVLARIAFAELLLDRGRPATVILDDALAFSDDERIESMFDVLIRASERVQIIVLTCRKRLFARLGAGILALAIEECNGP